jgi:co-chaperonin GroES (HSP10)
VINTNQISLRAYTKQLHNQDHHQLVLPLQGSITITVANVTGMVGLGDCVMLKSGQRHEFSVDEHTYFIVLHSETLLSLISE